MGFPPIAEDEVRDIRPAVTTFRGLLAAALFVAGLKLLLLLRAADVESAYPCGEPDDHQRARDRERCAQHVGSGRDLPFHDPQPRE